MDSQFAEKVSAGATNLGLLLTNGQLEQCRLFHELLYEWNERLNLTSVEKDQSPILHFVDSLSLSLAVDLSKATSLIDVGTGAGFPGIPLKIAFPHVQMVLMDSLQKRLNFLTEASSRLGLDGIRLVHARAEQAGRDPEYRERFEVGAARAVASLKVLSELVLPLVKVGGTMVAMKSQGVSSEIKEAAKSIEICGGELAEVKEFKLPLSDCSRSLIIIAKTTGTPPKYPRTAKKMKN